MTSAAGVTASTVPHHGKGPGSTPRAALQQLRVLPVPLRAAKALLVPNHYLHSLPGGTQLAFGVFVGVSLRGAVTMGVGPFNAPSVVDGATSDDCLTLSRLWLSDELPSNSASKTLGLVIRALKRHTSVKFLLTYADPSQGHVGIIYQATNWLYTGQSEAMPLYDLGDGVARHSRSVGHAFGSHSVRYLAQHGVKVRLVPQAAKHRHLYFLDRRWKSRLNVPVLRYPRLEERDEADSSAG